MYELMVLILNKQIIYGSTMDLIIIILISTVLCAVHTSDDKIYSK